MRHNPLNKASKPGQPTAYSPGTKPGGFTGLDPSRLGLGTPDWLEPSSPLPAPSADNAPLASDEYVVAAPHLPEQNLSHPADARTLLEGMKVVCICKGIKKRVFWKALDEGAQTSEDINRTTGSGSGSCAGRRCGPRIAEMLRNRI